MKKKIITIIVAVLIVAVLVSSVLYVNLAYIPNKTFAENRESMKIETYNSENGIDKIHFLNTDSSDAILLESNGRFALVDAGEDTDNPRGFEGLELKGFEDVVLDYLKKVAGDKNGKVHLDFVLGTHAHSDHIGGFDTIILDEDVEIDRAYLKRYYSDRIIDYENEEWDNQEVYDQMVNALNSKNIELVQDLPTDSFEFGNFTITLFNTAEPDPDTKVDENDNAIGTLVEKNGTRVFLAADINNASKDEYVLSEQIGKVNLLKIGHHSYSGSTTTKWLKTLMPDTCVVTNAYEYIDHSVINRIVRITDAPILVTGAENGIVAEIGDNGEITYYNQIHKN